MFPLGPEFPCDFPDFGCHQCRNKHIGNNSSELNIKAAISAFLVDVSEQDFLKLHRNCCA